MILPVFLEVHHFIMLKQQVNSDYFLSCFLLHFKFDTWVSKRLLLHFFDEIFQVFSANITKFQNRTSSFNEGTRATKN